MSAFERFRSIWVAPAIIAGLALGQSAPALVNFLASLEYGSVSLVVAALIWAMVYPNVGGGGFSRPGAGA